MNPLDSKKNRLSLFKTSDIRFINTTVKTADVLPNFDYLTFYILAVIGPTAYFRTIAIHHVADTPKMAAMWAHCRRRCLKNISPSG